MAYIGLKPTAGENNSFRILDTLSSFTATFDGSSASIVHLSNDTISIPEHRFITGQRVTYNDGGGTAITGLSDGVYYIIKVDRNLIRLASSLSNANNGTQINLTGLGAGISHTINVAFDGVNTKFKITHDSGTHAKVTRASQLIISINGVLQQPHDSSSPSSGIGIAADSVLVFSSAPATTDVVFGSIMSTNLSSFEISDNDIDNFTGDNSTTDFTMSKSPPDARNILVTLDGVVQYPSDASTTRAYSITENTISFVSAPATGVAIQVRHIGFAGGTLSGTNLVTSVFGKTGDVDLTSSDDITVRNITAVGATFTGVVTYEDVTNVDSLGIVTARTGVKVLAGGINAVGVVTATGGFNLGISSGGNSVVSGPVKTLNFIGAGNTFLYDASSDRVDISIAGGASGAGGTWGSNAVGVHTDKIVGINTSTIAGSATSEGALQVTGNIGITEGLLTLDSNLYTSVSVPSGKNALLIGPTTVAAGATIDIATGSTLVVV